MATLEIDATLRDRSRGISIPAQFTVETAGNHRQLQRITVGTAPESVAILADITGGNGPGLCRIENFSEDHFVKVGTSPGSYPMRVSAGQVALFELDAAVTTIHLQADTADADLELDIREA